MIDRDGADPPDCVEPVTTEDAALQLSAVADSERATALERECYPVEACQP